MRSENGRSLSFRHQPSSSTPWLGVCSGPRQSRRPCSGAEDGLFVRPLLWSTLHYLRGADPTSYEREKSASGAAPAAENMCVDRHPSSTSLARSRAAPLRRRPSRCGCCKSTSRRGDPHESFPAAIRGTDAWSAELADLHLPAIMRLPVNESWPMVGIVGAAIGGHRRRCLQLLRDELAPRSNKGSVRPGTRSNRL